MINIVHFHCDRHGFAAVDRVAYRYQAIDVSFVDRYPGF